MILASAVCFLLMSDAYIGDPVIYLAYAQNLASGRGFPILNPGEFSSGLTSPLWGLITTVCFLFPQPQVAAHFLGLSVLLTALYVGRRTLPKNDLSDIGLAVLFSLAVVNSIYFYETPLMLCMCFLMISGNPWAIGLLPWVRPEGIFISVAYSIYTHRYKPLWGLVPIALYWLLSWYLTGYFATSVVFRSSWATDNREMFAPIMRRYSLILIPFIIFALSKWYEKRSLDIHPLTDTVPDHP